MNLSKTLIFFTFISHIISGVCRALSKLERENRYVNDWEGLSKIFKDGEYLGSGAFGEVRQVDWRIDDETIMPVAIKKMKFNKKNIQSEILKLEGEVGILKLLGSEDLEKENKSLKKEILDGFSQSQIVPSIIDCLVDRKQKEAYVIMEMLEGTLTLECAKTPRKCPVFYYLRKPANERLNFYAEIARALNSMKNKGYVHEDVKPDNIGIAPVKEGPYEMEYERIRLIDFGLSRRIGKVCAGGTPEYMDLAKLKWFNNELTDSEEISEYKLAATASDVYSLGMTFFQLQYASYNMLLGKLDVDILDRFMLRLTRKVGKKGANAEQFIAGIQEITLNKDYLKKTDIYFCVVSTITIVVREGNKRREVDKNETICLYQVYFGMITQNRESRWTLEKIIKAFENIAEFYDNRKNLTDKEIANMETMSVDERAMYIPSRLLKRNLI